VSPSNGVCLAMIILTMMRYESRSLEPEKLPGTIPPPASDGEKPFYDN